ncbi:MAG: lipopolysaccharide heptosyltransferase I [Nitrospirae bacterium]|jgi:heptosyltransferase I|nr:lipopolysaccharide heptosyltransferase I [Nitrospirota bacterium]
MDSLIKLPLKNPEKILIVKPSSLGDVVHSLPFLNAIKTCFPQSEIHWVIAKGLEGLLEGHPMIDKLWIIRKDEWKKIKNVRETVGEIKTLFRNLKKEKFDIVIDLQGLLRSGVITSATGSAVRAGFSEAREGSRLFYTQKVEGGKNIHAVDRYLKIAEFLGCDTSDIRFPLPLFKKESFPTFLHSEDYAVFVPGARWKTKKWPPESFGKLSSLLPVRTIITGSKSDINVANEIVDLSNGKAISIAGKTELKELIEVMRGARFTVSNDSGPMHIAAALGVTVFALFGPTDPVRTGPYGKGHTVIKAEISCSPCFKKRCKDVKCMKSLSVEKVYEIIKLSFS